MVRVLITGGTGFVGQAIVRALAGNGQADITVLTRSASSQTAKALTALEHVTCLEADSPESLASVLDPARGAYDLVLHAASPGIDPQDRTWRTLNQGCTVYTLELLSALANHNIKRFVHVGSWSAYGPPLNPSGVLRETHWLDSANLYGAAKASAYLNGLAEAKRLSIPFVCARLFNVYGPGEADRRLIPYVVRQLLSGAKVPLTGGEQERDFIFIADAVEAILTLAHHQGDLEHTVYNICSGVSTPVRSVVETVADALNADRDLLDFGALDYRQDEPMVVVGEASRMANELNWTAQTPLDKGIFALVAALDDRGEGA